MRIEFWFQISTERNYTVLIDEEWRIILNMMLTNLACNHRDEFLSYIEPGILLNS